VKRKWCPRVNGATANGHRANGNRVNVVAPTGVWVLTFNSDGLIKTHLCHVDQQ